MFCTKCGSELREGVKFCTSCGAAVEEPPVAEETPVVEPTPVVESTQLPAPRKSNKGLLVAVFGVVAALIIAIVVCLWMIFGSTVSVATALGNTLNEFIQEVEETQEDVPGAGFFADFFEEQYTIKTTYRDMSTNVEVVVKSDVANEQIKISPSFLGMGGDIYLSNNDIVVDASVILGEAYGLQTQTLGKDYNESALATLMGTGSLPEDFGFDLFELIQLCNSKEATDALQNIAVKNTLAVFTELETEKLGKETITINGETVKTQAYRIELPTPEVFETYIMGMVDDILEDEAFAPYLEEDEMIALLESATGETLSQDIVDAMKETAEMMIEEYEDAYDSDLADLYFTGYIYKKQMVRLSLQSEDADVVVYGEVNPIGNILEYMALSMKADEDDENTVYTAELGMLYEDGIYSCKINIEEDYWGDKEITRCEIEFDTNKTKNNFVVEYEYADQYYEYSDSVSEVLSIDVTDEDVIYIEYEIDDLDATLEIEMNKDALEDDWFDFDPNYTNIFDMSEMDIYSIFMMAYSL